jgi:methionine aminotransferase
MAQIRIKQQFQINAVNTPLQYAFAEYLNKGYDKNQWLQEYEENRKLVSQIFYDLPFEFVPTYSTYFQLLSYKNISDLKDTEFVQKIMDNYGVALFPMSVFYHDYVDHKMVGLNFALNKEVLIEAANRLRNLK